jgi:Cofactor assembly of complex C subunit B
MMGTMVTNVAFYSSLILTLLIAVGLFFFIRASVKDRTKQEVLHSEVAPDTLRAKINLYFRQRAYQLSVQGETVTFQGTVRPSMFLAVFLSVLAFFGLGSVALVLASLVGGGGWFWGILLCPLAGVFYWQRAKRPEKVSLKIVERTATTEIHIQAQRDEMEKFKQALGFSED